MHDNMMMAEVGDIVNVRGSKMATPLAPPSPGSTPMSTPRMIPTNISAMFIGVRITAKPCIRALISSISLCSVSSVAEEPEGVECALEQGHLEPHLEHAE